ncbi:MAG: hypothetical protein DMG12_17200 [Acidobacteria bacterium]|nr:MAG: hypothetical protein DMG12_17200 [Acidobacteriota bacterium]
MGRVKVLIRRRKFLFGFSVVALLSLAVIYIAPRSEVATQSLPEKLSDIEFWKIITDFSEPGGFFRSDNFVSNESTFQHVIPDLRKRAKPGGVYLGVGPDQNFTYVAALRPKLAFVIDIRRQNMLEHLMYKALFELSENRTAFLSMLFSRQLPEDLNEHATTERLFEALNTGEPDPELAKHNLKAVLDQLRDHHSFSLSPDDVGNIEHVYTSFVTAGPEIRYSFPNQYGWRRFPSYSELMLETDEEGQNHSYMSSEESFRTIKQLQTENRIVPLVGDFAGEKALSAVGEYLKEHGVTVTAFYTSNVEFYLFQTEDWKKFFHNVADLPQDANSLFIRAYFNNYGFRFPNQASGARSVTLLDTMPGLLQAFEAGRIHSYFDVIKRSSQ